MEKRKQNMKEKSHIMSRQNIGEQELSDVIMREEMRSLRLSRRKTWVSKKVHFRFILKCHPPYIYPLQVL